MSKFACMILFLALAAGCSRPETTTTIALREFGGSLDSLLTGPVCPVSEYTVFDENILFGDPLQIRYVNQVIAGTDTIAVPANDFTVTFRNKRAQTIVYALSGKVQKYVYFDTCPNDRQIDSLLNAYRSTDTIPFGCAVSFDRGGRLIKSVVATEESRTLFLYRYDPAGRKTERWCNTSYGLCDTMFCNYTRYYYLEKDSASANPVQWEKSTQSHSVANGVTTDLSKCGYTFDERGNWVTCKDFEGPSDGTVMIRQIRY